MKKIVLIILCFVSISFAKGQDNSEYAKTLKKMFQVSGSEETYKAVISQMFTMFKQQYPDTDPEIWDDFELEFQKTSMDDLTDMLVPVYQKHLSIDDLKELIKFYESSIGKKFALSTPKIMQESMQVGQQWGMRLGEKFERKLQERKN